MSQDGGVPDIAGRARGSEALRDIRIYEPIYAPGQELSEPGFLPLPIAGGRSDWREFPIYVDIYRNGLHRHGGLTGLFSPKFRLKTGLTGEQFVAFCDQHQEADVCLVNPSPQEGYFCFNVWVNGELAHAGITARAQALLDAVGIPWRLDEQPHHGPDVLAYANFWVGTEAFWDRFVGGILLPIAEYLEANPQSEVAAQLSERTRYMQPLPYLPFITERLLTTFLSIERQTLRIAAYELDAAAMCGTEVERIAVDFLRPKVDRARTEGFDEALKELMLFTAMMVGRYRRLYYKTNPHPYIGRTIDLPD